MTLRLVTFWSWMYSLGLFLPETDFHIDVRRWALSSPHIGSCITWTLQLSSLTDSKRSRQFLLINKQVRRCCCYTRHYIHTTGGSYQRFITINIAWCSIAISLPDFLSQSIIMMFLCITCPPWRTLINSDRTTFWATITLQLHIVSSCAIVCL